MLRTDKLLLYVEVNCNAVHHHGRRDCQLFARSGFWIRTLLHTSPCISWASTVVAMSDDYSDNSSSKLGDHVGTGGRPLQIGDEIPNFTCESHMGNITLHSYINSGWGVIFT